MLSFSFTYSMFIVVANYVDELLRTLALVLMRMLSLG